MDLEAFQGIKGKYLTQSFSPHHEILMHICFGNVKPDPTRIEPLNDYLDTNDLRRLTHMVKVEFASSLSQEMAGSEDAAAKTDPKPFDVFLMETTLDRPKQHIAVCLPIKSKRRELAWYNGGKELMPLNVFTHKWRVASLSGAARVLEALAAPTTRLTQMAMQRTTLVEAVEDYETSLAGFETIADNMNESQQQAVATMIDPRFSEGFFAIQGPPGCGKTTTMVSMISVIGSGLLVVAPSNAAVANIALKLYSTKRFALNEIAVFGENSDPSAHFLSPKLRGDKFAKMYSRHEAEENPEKQEALLLEFITWLHLNEDNLSISDISEMCPKIDMDTFSGRQQLCNILQSSKVVFSTLNSAGSAALTRTLKVHTLMLDEGGQTPEADFYIATNFPGVKRIVVMGDPKQLPATVIDVDCKVAGFGDSWLGKIQSLHPEKVHLLNTQYRMDPQILVFPNRTFYNDRILSGDNVLSREIYVEKPFLFVDTDGRGQEEQEAFSWINVYEATAIKSLLLTDVDIQRLLRRSSNARIIIITPYRAQVKLLREIVKVPRQCNLQIATVDSFQGQEGDIVIISTVRTRRVGFVDDRQRLNVAITRAKRILRVVGDATFFCTLPPRSTLRRLCQYGRDFEAFEYSPVRAVAWSRPDWKQAMLWKPIGNARFYDCLKNMQMRDKNVCMNTLLAIAKPDCDALRNRIPRRDAPTWYTSCLKASYDSVRVVWTAKAGVDQPVIEAHFAGSAAECSRFVQIYHCIPENTCIVKVDLSGLDLRQGRQGAIDDDVSTAMQPSTPFAAWAMTNAVQHAVCCGEALPRGGVQLDDHQEKIARSCPPLIVESRSGTGKTLVLLQHAAYHADFSDERSACFVTVSPRLCRQLYLKYDEMNRIENLSLPPTVFFSFRELLTRLLEMRGIKDFEDLDPCRFLGYVNARRSHEQISVDPILVENEVGGVITGSLDAAEQRHPLSREQYLGNKRSNIENETDAGRSLRNVVFDEYEQYTVWKREAKKFDIHDVVLRLLRTKWDVIFSSGKMYCFRTTDFERALISLFLSPTAYLDEIQDLSYAAIYLICGLAGKDSLRWVCAGDPAQMISPGCSFTFDGLKQTLLSLREGIEHQLSTAVHHLVVNYRTTRDVLQLGNAILAVARREFPNAIGFAPPETSKKDLGIKVLLCDWKKALSQKVRLGENQALIYSSDDVDGFGERAKDWVGAHPFILSSLDSKGLEFDDVIIAFDVDRKAWNVDKRGAISLRLLRELYVAVTRAQRRVVILVKNQTSSMELFFESLDYDFQTTGAEILLREFDKETTPAMWRKKGTELFDDDQFEPAARCYEASGDDALAQWAQGKHFYETGNKDEAGKSYRRALREFYAGGDYPKVLDLALVVSRFALWNSADDEVVDVSLRKCPEHLARVDTVRLALKRGKWDDIIVDDLKDGVCADLFLPHRNQSRLKEIVARASDSDRSEMENLLPVVVGDFHHDAGFYDEAVRIYLEARDKVSAMASTEASLISVQKGRATETLAKIVDYWRQKSSLSPTDDRLTLLLELFQSPSKAASSRAEDCMRYLGRNVIILSVDRAEVDRTCLYDFSPSDFIVEVTAFLMSRFSTKPVEVVHWFNVRGDSFNADQFAKKRLSKWTNLELCAVAIMQRVRSGWLSEAVQKRRIIAWCMLVVMGAAEMSYDEKDVFVNEILRLTPLLNATEQSLVGLALALNKGNRVIAEKRRAAEATKIPQSKERDTEASEDPAERSKRAKEENENRLQEEKEKVRVFVQNHFKREPWSGNNLTKMVRTMRAIALIIKMAEPNTMAAEYRLEYSGIFREVASRHLAVEAVTGAKEEDKSWLVRAFFEYRISLEVPTELATEFARWSLQAGLRELALEHSWNALADRPHAEKNWPDILRLGMGSSNQDRAWLSQQFPTHKTPWQVPLLANPYISDYQGDTTISCLFHYGPAAAAYLRVYEGKDHSDAMLQLFVSHYAQLRQRIRTCRSEDQSLTREQKATPKTTATTALAAAAPALAAAAVPSPSPTTKMKTKKNITKQKKAKKGKRK
jgi:tetratricopeptide (TPR) repeat protein